MIPELRKVFNQRWTPAKYMEFLSLLKHDAAGPMEFRCNETPLFLPNDLLDKMVRYGQELYAQLAADSSYSERADAAIPAQFKAPNENAHPLFVQADFGLVRSQDGKIEPKLVEIQGFPSLYALQPNIARQYRRAYDIHDHLTTFLSGLRETGYAALLKKAIVGDQDPSEVALLEIDPYSQKTLPDFLLTARQFGVRIVDITHVKKEGRKLFIDGVPIKRIYNRVIVDELLRRDVKAGFAFSDDLDVEWAGHPNWFFKLSKFSLPFFKHECVPECWFLSDLKKLPDTFQDYVLKPLYSFAGLGVKINPSKEEVAAIPEDQRSQYLIQRKMDFVPTLETPHGPTKVEIRIMYIWDGEQLKAVTTLLRTGRGKMMGVDFNKGQEWVGASAGFHWKPRA